uniref:Uncharacterized protein n=1 Tax=Rhizophora mucronata TaxID=61149 RepID=A0A2P2NXT0_RHIMU
MNFKLSCFKSLWQLT